MSLHKNRLSISSFFKGSFTYHTPEALNVVHLGLCSFFRWQCQGPPLSIREE